MTDSIAKIYRAVPDVECKGLCAGACGPVVCMPAEEAQIVRRHGSVPAPGPDLMCSKLKDERCSIYEDRPLLCRVFGTTRGLPCPFGCTPKGGLVPDRKARKLFERMAALEVDVVLGTANPS